MDDHKTSRPSFWDHIGPHMHWHVVLTHFPISFFMVSAGFMFLHMLTDTECFEMASFLTLLAGAVMLVPTAWTGWTTWKSKYKGAETRIFRSKINITYFLLALCLVLIVTRFFLENSMHMMWHWIFSLGFILLFLGALMEGFYGGQLNHYR
jgi:uncharacterized membrane protein